MDRRKKWLWLLPVVLVAVVVSGVIWGLEHYCIVDGRLYPKNETVLDLRGQEIRPAHYEKLTEKLPETTIRWDVPFQDGTVADDTTFLTVTSLTDADVTALDYLTRLERVDGTECGDYEALLALQQRRPEVLVSYQVAFTEGACPQDTREITITAGDASQAELLPYLPQLEQVWVGGGLTMGAVEAIQATTHELGAAFGILAGGQNIPDTVQSVTVEGITEQELELLAFLPELTQLHLTDPGVQAEDLLALRETYPEKTITWEVRCGDLSFDDTVTEVDLSGVVIEDLAALESKMACLPNLQSLTLGLCGIDNEKWGASKTKNLAISAIENEDLAAYRDRVRDKYKVAWTVRLGPSIALRTDADNFMPNHFGVGQLPNDYAYNLRYCEDMVCLDVGHMTLTDISFVEYMPKLKYLILAWTEVQYIEPIRTCKNLIFLELDNSCIRDYSPLVDCTALEDLNIGKTFCDITPVLEMTWLKNLYMIFGSGSSAYKASQALTNTHVVASGDATVGSGWRRLQNYYDMRDCLHAPYMN